MDQDKIKNPTTALVVPTIRESNIKSFLEAWRYNSSFWDAIFVIEDNPEKTFEIDVCHHFSWNEIKDDLQENAWIISRRDSAIRSYGFLKAYEMGYDYIFTLDDDCLPVEPNFIHKHLNNFTNLPRWTELVPGFRTRGFPYRNLGQCRDVMFSIGLWEGTPDLDSVQSLLCPQLKLDLPETTRIMPIGQYFNFCGMNFCFAKEAAPLCYFPLMGQGYDFGRFDDIWFGVICKKICDHLNWLIACGRPRIFHSRASNPFDNLVKEAQGIRLNETFWEIIDGIKLCGSKPTRCMMEIGDYFLSESNEPYLQTLGEAMKIWASLFVYEELASEQLFD